MIRYWNEVRVNSNDGWYELAAVFCGNTLEDVQQMWYDEPNVNNRRLRNYFFQVLGHASTLLRGRSSRKHVCFAFVARTIPMSLGKT